MPQAAAARPGYSISKPSRSEFVHFKSSNNYTVELLSFDPRRLLLLADRHAGFTSPSTGYSQSASYLVTRRHPTQNGLHESFGELGQVSMRFRPSGPPQMQTEPGGHCKGRPSTEQKGRFVGSFRFRGERGFTSVHATNATGKVFRSFKQVCKRPHEPHRGSRNERRALSLGAYVKGDPARASFLAYELAPFAPSEPDNVAYSASATERRGRMTVTHSAGAFAEPSTFAVAEPAARPQTATVAPPFPFSGTATYERGPGNASSWGGDLSVDLPGLGAVPLTGPSFSVSLCRNLSCLCPPAGPCAFMGPRADPPLA
jgi:hypothetical protein